MIHCVQLYQGEKCRNKLYHFNSYCFLQITVTVTVTVELNHIMLIMSLLWLGVTKFPDKCCAGCDKISTNNFFLQKTQQEKEKFFKKQKTVPEVEDGFLQNTHLKNTTVLILGSFGRTRRAKYLKNKRRTWRRRNRIIRS
jgi:hypothetical protein